LKYSILQISFLYSSPMLRAGYTNRGRDEWAVHAGGSKDLQQTNKTQEKNTQYKVRPTKRIYLFKANGKQRPGFPQSNIG
jgi:hypothetical protein